MRKGHPWLVNQIMKNHEKYLEMFDNYYKRIMTGFDEKYSDYQYSFPAFIEIVRASSCEMGRDKHWSWLSIG